MDESGKSAGAESTADVVMQKVQLGLCMTTSANENEWSLPSTIADLVQFLSS